MSAFALCAVLTALFGYIVQSAIHRIVDNESSASDILRAEARKERAGAAIQTVFAVIVIIKALYHFGWLAETSKAALVPVVGLILLVLIAVYLKARADMRRAIERAEPKP